MVDSGGVGYDRNSPLNGMHEFENDQLVRRSRLQLLKRYV